MESILVDHMMQENARTILILYCNCHLFLPRSLTLRLRSVNLSMKCAQYLSIYLSMSLASNVLYLPKCQFLIYSFYLCLRVSACPPVCSLFHDIWFFICFPKPSIIRHIDFGWAWNEDPKLKAPMRLNAFMIAAFSA